MPAVTTSLLQRPRRRTSSHRPAPIQSGYLSPQRSIVVSAPTPFPPVVQAKLRIGEPNDKYEQEADRVADTVMRMPDHVSGEADETSVVPSPTPLWDQRMCPECKEDLQRKPRGDIQHPSPGRPEKSMATALPPDATAVVQGVIRSGGRRLDPTTRHSMESRFGSDFQDVRIHTRPAADEATKHFRARAFTVGKDIVFSDGEYRPREARGRHLLAHELTHVVQQERCNCREPWLQRQGVDVDEDVDESPTAGASSALTEAVRIVQGSTSGLGASQLTTDLVQGIERAEQRFLTGARKAAEIVGAGSSRGPTQLTDAAINNVDGTMTSAVGQFAALFGPAPADWEAKATHPEWYLFYTTAYLAWCINEAARLFQAVDSATGRVNLGIVMYLGAFESVRDLRREIAAERGIAKVDVTWPMIEDKAETYSRKLNDDVNYVRTVHGLADIPFIEGPERP
jgi:hypothetical protein